MKKSHSLLSIGGLIAIVLFVGVAWLMFYGLHWNTQHGAREVPSPLIGKPAPAFNLPYLYQPEEQLTKAEMEGQPYLLNVFASWCFACGEEHPVLMQYRHKLGVPLIGYNYKDKPADAKAWLERHGSPYEKVIVDQKGRTAIDFGVYGAPETYLIDAKGIIRYKHIGPLTPKIIANQLQPEINQLKQGADS